MTRAEIRTQARLQLGEPTTGGFWTDANFNSTINDGQRHMAVETQCLKSYAEFSTSSGVSWYDIGESSLDDMLDITEVRYYIDSSNYNVLLCVSRDELSYLQNQNEGTQGYPTYYCYEDRAIEFDCTTDADKTCRVYYYRLPTTMSADATVSDIPVKFHDVLVNYVCWKFSEADDLNERRVAYYKGLYEQGLNRIRMIVKVPASSYQGIRDDTEIPFYGR